MIRLAPIRPPRAGEIAIFDYSREISGVRIRIRLEWRERRGAWYGTVWADGTLLIQGRRFVEGSPLLWRHRFVELPLVDGKSGRLILIDLSEAHEEVGQEGLGWTHELYWLEPSDQYTPPELIVDVT